VRERKRKRDYVCKIKKYIFEKLWQEKNFASGSYFISKDEQLSQFSLFYSINIANLSKTEVWLSGWIP
jgi:hypothetical protein